MTRRWMGFITLGLFGAAVGAWATWLLLYRDTVPSAESTLLLKCLVGAALGLCTATWLALVIDSHRAGQLMAWLQLEDPEARSAPFMRGAWGEAAERMRRHMRRAESDVALHRGRLQDIISALQVSPNGLILLDGRMCIEWCNRPATTHFGIDPVRDELQALGNLVRDPALVRYIAGQDFQSEVVITGRDHTGTHPVRLSIQLHRYGEGRSLLISRDITALEQAEAMRRDFVANVSHEIRTPLTVLTGFVETLQNLDLSAEEQARYLDVMRGQADRMQALVDDLLNLSRLEGRARPDGSESVPLHELLRQCEDEAGQLSEVLDRRHSLVFPPPDGPVADVLLVGSQRELHSAITNLLANAIRYTPANGSILVSWGMDSVAGADPADSDVSGVPVSWLLSIEDNGPGIAEEHLPRLTERFYRMDRSRSRESGGTGLGLAIVKHVMQRHGGLLKIDTRQGFGSKFSLALPASRVQSRRAVELRPGPVLDLNAKWSRPASKIAVTANASALESQNVAGSGRGAEPPMPWYAAK